MVEDEVDPEEVVEYAGQKVLMCCGTCVKAWNTNPDYYAKVGVEMDLLPQIKELPEAAQKIELLAQRFCPLRPDSVIGPDSPSIEYQGQKIYFFKERDIARRWERDAEAAFASAREKGLLPQFDEVQPEAAATEPTTSASDVLELTITADKIQLAYDTKSFEVAAGQKVSLTLANPEQGTQPHNLLVINPGTINQVGMAANQGMTDPNFLKNPVPKSDQVLFASKLVQPGESDVLEFTAPEKPGTYPYICTFPGHWMMMRGEMVVK